MMVIPAMQYVFLLISYLFGAIPFGLLITRWRKGIDIREHGSGNIGFTNVLRVVGFKSGIVVLILDIGKGAISVWLARRFTNAEILPVLCGMLAIIGHDWPVYLKFRGGKGVATTIGVFLVLAPWATLVALVIWVASVATTRYVSVGSILFALNLPIATFVLGLFCIRPVTYHAVLIAGCVAFVITVFKHRSNIQRLMQGTENRLGR